MSVPYVFDSVDNCLNCELQNTGFFCGLSSVALRAFQKVKFSTNYPKGATLFGEGQAAHGVLILCSGRVKLFATSVQGKTAILRFAGPGELLGLSAIVRGQSYDVTAVTMEPCQLNLVRREDFLDFMRRHNEVCFRVAEQLSRESEFAWKEFCTLNFSRSACERLADLLLRWCNGNARLEHLSQAIRLTATHEEIAQMIGTSRETVTRLLATMKRQQILQVKGSVLLIQDVAALKALANPYHGGDGYAAPETVANAAE